MRIQHTMKKAGSRNGQSSFLTPVNWLRSLPEKGGEPRANLRCYFALSGVMLLGSLASSVSAATISNNLANAPSSNAVVILDTTITGGASSVEAVQALGLGYDVVINNAATWGSMTQANFATYRAIILGDPNCQTTTTPITAAVTNRTTWSPAITGNMIIIGVDPAVHKTSGSSGTGGTELTHDGIAFAAADSTKTGAYITMSCYYSAQATAIPPPLLDQFGPFLVKKAPSNFNNSHIVATHPAFVGLTDSELSNWSQSVHEIFDQWPLTFQVFAIAPNVGSVYTATDGTIGTPYILTRGTTVISNIHLGPDTATNPVGVTHTVTATILPVPSVGTLVTFKIISGPNVSLGTLNPPVGTNASGTASKTYSGTGGPGTDLIVATYVDSAGKVQTSNTVAKTWVATCAEFSATTVCQGTATAFTDLSTGATSWNWNFGETTSAANTSTQQNPTHTYTNPGTYTVKLSVNGGACTVTHTVTVTAGPPLPIITGPDSTCGKTATYCITKAPNCSYAWNVTNGTMTAPTTTGNQICITVTWNSTGNGLITIKVNDGQTCCSLPAQLLVRACDDHCCEEIKGAAATDKDPQPLGGGLYSFTPALSAAVKVMRVTATVISTSQTFTTAACGTTGGPVNSYVKPPLSSVTGFASSLPVTDPREVDWNSSVATGVNISAGIAFPFNIQFPPQSFTPTETCPDIIRFCVKYTFTDAECRTCDIIRCYLVQRPGGGPPK